MRRLCLLFALVGLMSAILAGAGGAADARTVRRKTKAKAAARPAAAAIVRPAGGKRRAAKRTRAPAAAAEPTSPDVIPRRLMIVGFDGRGAQVPRGAAADALRRVPSVRVVPLSPTDAMRLGTAYGAEKTVGLAQRLNLTAVLYGKITQAPRDVQLNLLLANGEDGRTVGEIPFEARSLGALRTKLRTQLWSKLGPLIDQAASPGRAEVPETPLARSTTSTPSPPADEETPNEGVPDTSQTRPSIGRVPDTSGTSGKMPDTLGTGDVGATKPSGTAGREPRVPRPVGRSREFPEEKGRGTGRTLAEAQPESEDAGTGEEAEGAKAGRAAGEEAAPAPDDESPTTKRTPHKGRTGQSGDLGPAEEAGHEVAGGVKVSGTEAPGSTEVPDTCPIVEVAGAGGVMARRFNYRDEQRGALRGYSLYRAPVGRVDGALYPFAGARCHGLAGLGLHGAYEQMGPLNSQLADRELGTQASAYQVDLVLRLTRGRLTLQPAVGFLARRYHVDGDAVPAADYRAIGGGLDASMRFHLLAFAASAGAWRILNAGALQSAAWFPQQSGYAFATRAQVSLAASSWIDIVAGAAAEYETFAFTVDQNAANPNGVASGAFDFYVQATLAVRFRLGLSPTRPKSPAP